MPVVGVVRGDVAAHAELGAAVADDDLALDDARRAGDRVALASDRRSRTDHDFVAGRAHRARSSRPSSVPTKSLPSHAATPRLTTSQQAFTPSRPAPSDRIATAACRSRRRAPAPCSTRWWRTCTPSTTERRRFLAAMRVEIEEPREPQLLDVARVDLRRAARSAARSKCGRASASCRDPGPPGRCASRRPAPASAARPLRPARASDRREQRERQHAASWTRVLVSTSIPLERALQP